jgi:MFS family permease
MVDIRDRHVILAMACLAQFVVLLVVYSVGALAPLLRDALHLSREQIGSLTTLFFLGAILASIPVGWLADRLGVRGFLIAVQGVSGLAVAAIPWLHTYRGLLGVMFLAGVGHGTVMVLTNKALYDWFPRERLATAMGAKFVAISCPGIVAGTAIPMLALWVGWQQALALVGGLTLTSALGALLLYRDPPHEGPRPAPLPVSDGRRGRWLDRGFWCLVTAGFLFAGAAGAGAPARRRPAGLGAGRLPRGGGAGRTRPRARDPLTATATLPDDRPERLSPACVPWLIPSTAYRLHRKCRKLLAGLLLRGKLWKEGTHEPERR